MRAVCICGHVVFLLLAAPAVQAAENLPDQEQVHSALARYVAKPDPSYKWVKRREGKLGLGRYVELTLTSQIWQDIVWKHQLFIIKPSTVAEKNRHALLFITGGSWNDGLEQADGAERLPREATAFALAAESLRTPVAVLRQVPHQPILEGKYEDQIIAHTFKRFMETGDAEWPLLLPMVKSAVRGMDAVDACCRQQWSLPVDTFTVSGASKRGWTTWLTAAVDRRVTALAPMVIDMLNMERHIEHQRKSWGQLSYEISDYSELKLDQQLATPRGRQLQAIVDPYQYRRSIRQPKLIMIGTNDDYWPLDSLNLYWDDLEGPKYILYVPNNRHGLNDMPRLVGGLNALNHHAANGYRLPALDWTFQNGGGQLELELTSDVKPTEVLAWVATADQRDFRNSRWQSHPAELRNGRYVCRVPVPEKGFAALFGEAQFEGPGLPLYLSTNVRVLDGGK